MKLLAFSDLHGRWLREAARLIAAEAPDWIILLGDVLPDFDLVAGARNRLACQQAYWQDQARHFEGTKGPTTFLRGNHEVEGFQVPARHRQVPPSLAHRVLCLEGIPGEGGFGDRPSALAELERELGAQRREHPEGTLVLSHVPPLGCLDAVEPGVHIGNAPLGAWLGQGGIAAGGLVLCGHVHEAFGSALLGGCRVVNLACGYASVSFEEGGWKLVRLERMVELRARQRDAEGEEGNG